MTPFAIAGIQMHVSALHDNIAVMGRRLDLLMARFPWVQMVVFSELAPFGPLPGHAQPMPGPAEAVFSRSIVVGPSGYVIHAAGGGEETIPVEINLDRVRREREAGIRGLGQPLKSFRDWPVDFPVYQRGSDFPEDYLRSLGPLAKPERGSRAGLKQDAAPVAGQEGYYPLTDEETGNHSANPG